MLQSVPLLAPPEVAQQLALTVQRVGELCRAGSLPSFKIGKFRRVTVEALEKFKVDLASGRLKLPPAPRKRAPVTIRPSRRPTLTNRSK